MADTVIEIVVEGPQGVPGGSGVQGPIGQPPAVRLSFSNNVADSDPGAGVVKLNHLLPQSATQIFVDNSDINGASIVTWLDALDDSTTLADRGVLTLMQIDAPVNFAVYRVTGGVVDGTGYRKVPVTCLARNGSFGDGKALALGFARSGDKGSNAAASDVTFTPTGGLAATNVQAALVELDSEKATPAAVASAISAAISGLVDAAPGTLDTLNELAAALGDDPNFAATILTTIAARNQRRTVLAASGNFTTPANITAATVFNLIMTGGGGGGMGGQANNVMGAGGAGGCTVLAQVTGLAPSTNYAVVIGAGGTAGATAGGAGGSGGNTTFASPGGSVVAPGGGGAVSGAGGVGGTAGAANHQVAIAGGDGGDSTQPNASWASAGAGGASYWGGGGAGGTGTSVSAGKAGKAPGSGGGGGAATSGAAAAGGAGRAGLCVIEWVS